MRYITETYGIKTFCKVKDTLVKMPKRQRFFLEECQGGESKSMIIIVIGGMTET